MLRIAFLALFMLEYISPATAGEVDRTLCNNPWPSEFSSYSTQDKLAAWSVRTISECEIVPIKSLGTPDPKLVTALSYWAGVLWSEKTMELTEVYRYRLTIINDSENEALIGLIDPEVMFSPYTAMVRDIGFRMPRCGKLVLSFLAAGGPMFIESKLVLGGPHMERHGRDWSIFAGSASSIVLPKWQFGHHETVEHTTLPASEARTHACK